MLLANIGMKTAHLDRCVNQHPKRDLELCALLTVKSHNALLTIIHIILA